MKIDRTKLIILLIIISIPQFLSPQINRQETDTLQIYTIKDFSDFYYAKISILDTNFESMTGYISIHKRSSNEEMIRVKSNDIYLESHNGILSSNVVDLYGEQSLVIYKDFNFDGERDFAIQDGRDGCYGGPSYSIYLLEKNKFVHNNEFSNLAHGNCGMFYVDTTKKSLVTFDKSGCCIHYQTYYKVINNTPVAFLKIVEEVVGENGMIRTTRELVNDKWIETIEKFDNYYKDE